MGGFFSPTVFPKEEKTAVELSLIKKRVCGNKKKTIKSFPFSAHYCISGGFSDIFQPTEPFWSSTEEKTSTQYRYNRSPMVAMDSGVRKQQKKNRTCPHTAGASVRKSQQSNLSLNGNVNTVFLSQNIHCLLLHRSRVHVVSLHVSANTAPA